MRDRLHHPLMGVSVRVAGLAVLGLSWLCGHELWRLHGASVTVATFLLALMTFLTASAAAQC